MAQSSCQPQEQQRRLRFFSLRFTVPRPAAYPDLPSLLRALCRLFAMNGTFGVVIETRLPVQSASPMPIERRRAYAALTNRFGAAGCKIRRIHIESRPPAATLHLAISVAPHTQNHATGHHEHRCDGACKQQHCKCIIAHGCPANQCEAAVL